MEPAENRRYNVQLWNVQFCDRNNWFHCNKTSPHWPFATCTGILGLTYPTEHTLHFRFREAVHRHGRYRCR